MQAVWKENDIVDVFHGVSVPDPFRWLEDPSSADTRSFVQIQNEHTYTYFQRIHQRSAIRARLEERWNYPKYFVPERAGIYYFI